MKVQRNAVHIFVVGFCSGALLLTISSLTFKKEKGIEHIRPENHAPLLSEVLTDEFTNLVESLQRERYNTILNACKKWDRSFSGRMKKPNMNALYSDKYKFAVCDIPKCASSSWFRAVRANNFVKNDVTHSEIIEDLRNNTRYGSKFLRGGKAVALWNQHTYRIITVRNPFHRLVSAYDDKLVRSPETIYRKMSLHIKSKFRHLRQNAVERNTTNGPATFEDFVHYLLTSKIKDSSWRSFNVTCEPCAVTYDYVMKFETLKEDAKYLRSHLNLALSEKNDFFPAHQFYTNDDVVKQHFNKLPKSLALELFKHYKLDFNLFGYPRPDWL